MDSYKRAIARLSFLCQRVHHPIDLKSDTSQDGSSLHTMGGAIAYDTISMHIAFLSIYTTHRGKRPSQANHTLICATFRKSDQVRNQDLNKIDNPASTQALDRCLINDQPVTS